MVQLSEQHRQAGEANKEFVSMLQRLRDGRCNRDDVEMLNGRLLKTAGLADDKDVWKKAPMIVSSNAVKDALNEQCASQFAKDTCQQLHWYYAVDQRSSGKGKNPKDIEDPILLARLCSLHSGKTKYRLGKIPLVIGMPVLVSQNYDVQGGIVNGSHGTVREIRYTIDNAGNRHLTSCIVDIPNSSGEPMLSLPPKTFPILVDTQTMNFTHPHTRRSISISRSQVPIVPAFAMTAHRAQGQTFDHVIVDLESCQGTEAPYVMVSRASSLEGLLVLRSFQSRKIMCSLSQDARVERCRVNRLRLRTLIKYGTPTEVSSAMTELGESVGNLAETDKNVFDSAVDRTKELTQLQDDYEAMFKIGVPRRITRIPLTDNPPLRSSLGGPSSSVDRQKRKVSGEAGRDDRKLLKTNAKACLSKR